jgi:hypothetical protein
MSDNGRNPDRREGAFEGEMAEWELERNLGGFAAEMRGALMQAPDHETTERHLRAMLAAAEAPPTAQATVAHRGRPRLAALRIAAVAGASVVALSAGLAIAGVRPPEPISDMLESMGVDVPGSDAASSEESAPPANPGGEAGGSGGPASKAAGEGSRAGGERRADERSHGRRGEEASAEGQETAAEASSGGAPPSSPGASDATPPQDPGRPADPGSQSQVQGPPLEPPAQGRPEAPPGAAQSEAALEDRGPG